MGRRSSQLIIFNYRDYRRLLEDWFDEASKNKKLTHRSFAKKAGFVSSSFLMRVIQGKRNLTDDSLAKMLKGLNLNKQEEEFFRNLVFFNQSKDPEAKDHYYERLVRSKKLREIQPIERAQYEYYSTWYHPVIRELVVSKEFDGTPEWLSKRLLLTVTPSQCAKSISLLKDLGFIAKAGKKKYKQTNPTMHTGAELVSLVVHNYHKVILDLSKQLMDQLSRHHREVSTLTLGIKRSRIPQLKARLREFQQEVLSSVANDTPEEVVQMSFQFYPLTKVTGSYLGEDHPTEIDQEAEK